MDLTLHINQKQLNADMQNRSFYRAKHISQKGEITKEFHDKNNQINKNQRRYEGKSHYKVGEEDHSIVNAQNKPLVDNIESKVNPNRSRSEMSELVRETKQLT